MVNKETVNDVADLDRLAPKILIENLNIFYGDIHAVRSVNMALPDKKVTALIGPSGCGKSTLLRSLNRMNDLRSEIRTTGCVLIDRFNIYDKAIDINQLRRKVGIVFQKANPFPMSIFDNIAYGPRVHGYS